MSLSAFSFERKILRDIEVLGFVEESLRVFIQITDANHWSHEIQIGGQLRR